MRTCETCKHWRLDPDLFCDPDHGVCERVAWPQREREPAWVSEYAQLRTLPTFGCVLHEEREG